MKQAVFNAKIPTIKPRYKLQPKFKFLRPFPFVLADVSSPSTPPAASTKLPTPTKVSHECGFQTPLQSKHQDGEVVILKKMPAWADQKETNDSATGKSAACFLVPNAGHTGLRMRASASTAKTLGLRCVSKSSTTSLPFLDVGMKQEDKQVNGFSTPRTTFENRHALRLPSCPRPAEKPVYSVQHLPFLLLPDQL